jgi:hypothetical protein
MKKIIRFFNPRNRIGIQPEKTILKQLSFFITRYVSKIKSEKIKTSNYPLYLSIYQTIYEQGGLNLIINIIILALS